MSDFLVIGNQLWLDLVNTEILQNGQRVDLIATTDALDAWRTAAGLAEGRGGMDLEVLAKTHRLRANLRDLAAQVVQEGTVPEASLLAINEALRLRIGYEQIVPTPRGCERRTVEEQPNPEQFLAVVADSAADFLCDSDRTLLRRCENPACILYFFDTSKNHARRWCSMSACGNRHKAAAHYQRSRETSR